jgi:branched-chain amino acid transport system substrate-binding protein
MSKTAKWIVAIIVIILIIAGVWYWQTRSGASLPAGERSTITIGATLPLSGNLAFLGEPYKNAMLLALDKAMSNPDLKYNYKIVFEDDQFDPTKGVTAVNKLISIDKVDALTSFGSPVGSAIAPIAEQNKITHLNGIASDPSVAVGDYNFVHWTPPYEEVDVLLSEFEKRGIKNVVLFEQNMAGALALANSFRDKVGGTGVNIVATESYNSDVRDFRTSIQKVKGLQADAYLLLLASPQLEILAKQIQEAGIEMPLTTIEGFMFTDQPELFTGLWYVAPADMQQWFVDEFTTKYGSAPKLGGGNGYDAVTLLVSAFEEAGNGKTKPTEQAVQKALAKVKNFSGAMGEGLSVDSSGLIVTKALIKTVE